MIKSKENTKDRTCERLGKNEADMEGSAYFQMHKERKQI